jgi:hypothetical protein
MTGSRNISTYAACETPNIYALRTLIDNWSELDTSSLKDPEDAYDRLRDLVLQFREGKGIAVRYSYSTDAKTHGRQFANGPSLQHLKKELRHTICHDTYTDYDIVNAHPVILVQYCHKKDYECEALEYYIAHRDECLAEINLPREEAKKIPLALINGGTGNYEALDSKPAWLANLAKEVKCLHTNLLNDPKNKALLKHLADKQNLKGSLCNHILCDIENQILVSALKFLGEPKNISLQFDGFMLPKDVPVDLERLQDFIHKDTKRNLKRFRTA